MDISKQQKYACTSLIYLMHPDSNPISFQLLIEGPASDICFQFYGIQDSSFLKEFVL